MSNVIVACENAQEFSDLCDIARSIKNSGRIKVIFFDVTPVYGRKASAHDADCFDDVILAIRVPGRPFGESSPIRKLVVATINAAWLAYQARRRKARVLLTGVPLLIFRLARLLSFAGFRHISYIRSIVADSGATTSLSSRMHLAVRGLTRLRSLNSIFTDYMADAFMCVGETTRRFLLTRGAPEQAVIVVGSVSCDRMIEEAKRISTDARGSPAIVFMTSAFLWHGNLAGHLAQLELLSELASLVERANAETAGRKVRLIVRVHPRDDAAAYDSLAARFGCIAFDRFGADFFIRYPKDCVFLSAVSTLTVELARVGADSRFIANDAMMDAFSLWYRKNGIEPMTLSELAVSLNQTESERTESLNRNYTHVIDNSRSGAVAQACAEICIKMMRA